MDRLSKSRWHLPSGHWVISFRTLMGWYLNSGEFTDWNWVEDFQVAIYKSGKQISNDIKSYHILYILFFTYCINTFTMLFDLVLRTVKETVAAIKPPLCHFFFPQNFSFILFKISRYLISWQIATPIRENFRFSRKCCNYNNQIQNVFSLQK